jgi:hypothetical protein
VTYGATADLYTTRPVARAEILPMSPLEFPVYDTHGYASASYSVLVGKGNLGAIDLACSGPVARGETVSCTATPGDPTQTLTVTGWRYQSVDGDARERQANVSSATWQGRLAVDGEIVVYGRVGGVAGQSAPRPVKVVARNWQGMITRKDHAIVSPSTLLARPVTPDSLGKMFPAVPLDMATQAQWSVYIDDDGPNQGFLYLTAIPVITLTRPQVNTNALNGTSDFYRIQESRQRKIGGVTYCAQSFVLGIIPMIQAHEGYDPDNQPNSHAGIFRRHVDSVAYRFFERAAGPSDGPAVTSRKDSVYTEAFADAKAMDTDARNNENNVTVPCQFHYDYSRLK